MQKRTLLILINIVIFLSITVVGIGFLERLKYQVVNNFVGEEQNHEMAFAENIANTLQMEMDNQVTLLTQLTQLPEIQNSDPTACNKKLDDLYLKYGKKLTNIGRMNAKGIFDCSHNRTAIGINGPERAPHLKQIIEDPVHKAVLGRIIPSATPSANLTTSFHVPIFDSSGKFLGTLGGAINFNDLKDKYLKNVTILQQGYATINDDNGDTLYHPRAEFMGKNVWSEEMQNITGRNKDLNEMWKNSAAGKKGTVRYVFEDKEKIAAYAPAVVFPGRVWSVVVTVPLADLQKTILTQTVGSSFLWLYGIMAGLMILFFIILSFFENKWLFKPLTIMNTSLKKLSQGDLTADIPLVGSGKDEFGQLAENLRLTLSSLREKTTKVDVAVSEKTKALEQKIVELETANKAMAGRELKMMELKKEIETLKKQLNAK